MKIDSLFPTTWRDTNFPLFQFEATDRISALGDGFLNYWLGYMKYDKIPSVFFTSEFMTGTNVIRARVNNSQVNSPVGYTCDDYGYRQYQYGYIKETGFTPSWTYNRYLNSFAVRTHGTQINFSTGSETGTQISIILETGNDESLGTFNRMYLRILSSDDMSTSGVIGFLQGNRDMTFTETINGVSVSFVLKSADLEENGVATYTGNAAGLFYKMTVFISGYGFNPYVSTDSQGNNRYFDILPTLKMYSDYGNYYIFRTCGVYSPNATRVDTSTGQFYLSGNYNLISGIGLLGGWEFDFSLADLSSLPSYGFLISGNTMAVSLGSVAELYRIYKPSDLLHHFALMMRIPSTPSFGYTVGVYCPEVLDDGEFTGNLLTGDLTEDDVQPWQWDNINVDEFKEEDIPEYEPEPSGDEDPFGGSNWLTNSFPYGGTDGFVTQYVLTESQLQSFGANLWAKFFTQDFWESICVILPESLSINASDILNYVVSLREYPFDVTAVGNCASDDPIIFIGRGIVGVTVSGRAIYRMLEYNGHISIESNTIEPYFGDFRDYEPCTRITLFVPFCGVVELTPSQVIGGTITLRYSIDFSTGSIQCTVQVNRGAFTTNLNTLSGSVGANVQMSASNLTQVLQKGAGMVANFSKSASMFAIGMGEVGMAEGAIASAESEQEIANAVGKFQSGVTKAQSAFSIPDLNGVPVPVFGQSGGFASFQITEPMIQRTYHYYELPSNYAHVYGYACNKTVTLSTLENKGFTVCKNVDLSGIPATQDELSAIESLLTSGVYF